MENKGYLILAQNNSDTNYIRLAYALALSIKNTQSTINNVTLATSNLDIPKRFKSGFDNIVGIPWKDHALDSTWKIENKWKYYYMTPYEETVVLDADMLFTSDISFWWDVLNKKEICLVDKPRTYKSEVIKSDAYRKTFTSNNLPNVYTTFMYFKKTIRRCCQKNITCLKTFLP